ncbi:hypothetical protein AM363_08065 [Citrobacter freundii]|uniref:Prophage protein n=1 Tax=Citrobacter freundii TaxID=546 RepID=A0AB33GWG2_CITFR|nr:MULTISPECIES: hypothetical protein [Citrobacter]AMH12484.1 hypothetical protein AL515_00785 [Citrobacter sp. FDAARGOS_156]AUZ63990.1 hypothetical protein C2U53_09130 [Citrobacter sp. CFNIH10]AXZ46910.1 hypothetical protein AM363_08065 [Citrobacter freundii]MDU7776370.1 hypothetical protein [Citrobacter sp.]
MSHEITLEQAAASAHQSEIICRLIEECPRHLTGGDISTIAALLKRLNGDVTAWLIEEMAEREEAKK